MRASLPGSPSDFWWLLATGRYIVQTGHLPTQDVFTYTQAGHPWIAHEWLWEVIAYEVYRAGGYLGLMLMRIAVFLPAALMLT